jgi:hypothetical protein
MAMIINPDWGRGHVLFAEEAEPVYEPYDISDLPVQDIGPTARIEAINQLTELRVAARAALIKRDAFLYLRSIAENTVSLERATRHADRQAQEARAAIRAVLKLRRDLALFQGA